LSLNNDNPELKRATEACKKEVIQVIKKHFEDYLEKMIAKWVGEELGKMGYLEKEKPCKMR